MVLPHLKLPLFLKSLLARCRETCLNHLVMTILVIFIGIISLDQPGLLSTDLVGSAIIVVEGVIFGLSATAYMGGIFISIYPLTGMLFLAVNLRHSWNVSSSD